MGVRGTVIRQTELDKEAGAAIKNLRKAAGLSQEELADSSDVDQSALSKAERLGPGAIGWVRFCRVANQLGFAVEICLTKAGSDTSLEGGRTRVTSET